jgi:pimeloyl-ACP methyl ester carboxylesterase
VVEGFHGPGYTSSPVPVFYEEFSPAGAGHPAIVVVRGSSFSGSCYLAAPDGRPGWAGDFLRHGYRVVIPDMPGVGRSACIASDDVNGQIVAQALGSLLGHLGQRVVLLVHSMSGRRDHSPASPSSS